MINNKLNTKNNKFKYKKKNNLIQRTILIIRLSNLNIIDIINKNNMIATTCESLPGA